MQDEKEWSCACVEAVAQAEERMDNLLFGGVCPRSEHVCRVKMLSARKSLGRYWLRYGVLFWVLRAPPSGGKVGEPVAGKDVVGMTAEPKHKERRR